MQCGLVDPLDIDLGHLDPVSERALQRASGPDLDHAAQRLVERLEQRRTTQAGAELGVVQPLPRPGEQHESYQVGHVSLEVRLGQLPGGREPVRMAR